mgnify:CR=1 FL=1
MTVDFPTPPLPLATPIYLTSLAKIEVDNLGKLTFTEEPKGRPDGKKLLSDLWVRLKGN